MPPTDIDRRNADAQRIPGSRLVMGTPILSSIVLTGMPHDILLVFEPLVRSISSRVHIHMRDHALPSRVRRAPVLATSILIAFAVRGRVPAQLDPEKALASMQPAEDLEVSLFASDPDLVNPTCIDVDPQGRAWIPVRSFSATFSPIAAWSASRDRSTWSSASPPFFTRAL